MLLLLTGAAGALALGVAYAVDRGASVVVRSSDGGVISRALLPDSGGFEIEYVHSYYNVPATEHFTTNEDGSFELVGVSSFSEAVIDYYELEGRKEIEGELLRLVLDEPQEFEALPLIGTQRGGRTLVVSGELYPLYDRSGARHVTVEIEKDIFVMIGRLWSKDSWQVTVPAGLQTSGFRGRRRSRQ